MNHNNNEVEQLQKPYDLKGIRNKHAELHSLLAYICLNQCKPFTKLSGSQQRHLLRLAMSASEALADCINPS